MVEWLTPKRRARAENQQVNEMLNLESRITPMITIMNKLKNQGKGKRDITKKEISLHLPSDGMLDAPRL